MNILSTFTHDLSHEITLRVLCGVSVTCHHQPMWTPVRKLPAFVMQPLPAVFSRELKTEWDEGCRIGHLRLGRIPVRGEAGRQATVLTAVAGCPGPNPSSIRVRSQAFLIQEWSRPWHPSLASYALMIFAPPPLQSFPGLALLTKFPTHFVSWRMPAHGLRTS